MMVFNRPELAEGLARIVATNAPPAVYVACDGPRSPAEADVVAETLRRVRAVLDDSGTTTYELVREKNLGCKRAVEEAITWFFDREEAGIVLEDDCHPSPTFFGFCDLMLDRYRLDERVMHVSGYSEGSSGGYRFSRFPAVWGWATWRRAWHHYPLTLPQMDPPSIERMRAAFSRREHLLFFVERWERVRAGDLDTWDFSWVYAVRSQGGLAVQPNINLVRNVGFGDDRAAHTRRPDTLVDANHARDTGLGSFGEPPLLLPDDRSDHAFFRSRMAGRLALVRSFVRGIKYARRPSVASGTRRAGTTA